MTYEIGLMQVISGGNTTVSPAVPEEAVTSIVEYLRNIAAKRHVQVELMEGRAQVQGRVIVLPARICGTPFDAFENAQQLQDLEDAWNDQEPRPDFMLILRVNRRNY